MVANERTSLFSRKRVIQFVCIHCDHREISPPLFRHRNDRNESPTTIEEQGKVFSYHGRTARQTKSNP
jgi:hypothetical protein